jgi:calcium-dependent protein kinase
VWNIVTPELKDLINHLLCPQTDRFTSEDALEHHWFVMHDTNDTILTQSIPNCLKRLKRFANYDRIKRIIYTYVATRLDESKIYSTAEIFNHLDGDKDGVLKSCDLRAGLNCESKEFKQIFNKIDCGQDGDINYTEWIAAAKNWDGVITEEMIKDAFNAFDKDSDGEIDAANLKSALFNSKNEEVLSQTYKSMIAEVDKSGEGKLRFPDFMKMFESRLYQ